MFLVSEHLSVKLGAFIPEKNRDRWQVLSSIFSNRQGIAMTQFDNQPAFQHFAQGFLAFVKRVAKRKNARTIRDFSASGDIDPARPWLNLFRKLTSRDEKLKRSYEGLLQLACAMICWRQTIPI